MNAKILAVLAVIAIAAVGGAVYVFAGQSHDSNDDSTDIDDSSRTSDTTIDTGEEDTEADSAATYEITYVSGTENAFTISSTGSDTTITFSGLDADTVYSISGKLEGNIVIDAGDYDFELDLEGVTISSSSSVPIYVSSGDNVDISAKKNTVNKVYDNRSAVSDDDTSAAIFSDCDLTLKGKGELVVISYNNNGIHSKDDLTVKNLTLYVTCVDNALKGNDSVTITSGTIVLNATSGDGIKTTSTDLNKNGEQRGTVTINSDDGDTSLTIKAYCDGIDAAFDVSIEQTEGSLSVDIIAGTGATSTTSTVYGAPMGGGPGWGGMPGGNSWNQRGPDSDGNSNKVDYSCKGIKASNGVYISSGTVTIDAYDDAIHANNDDSMESGVTPKGEVIISGGTVTLNSKDDAIHSDGALKVTSGTLKITGSYEGLEGASVTISGGNVSIVSSDDGINSSGTITISGGYVYVYAGGDGIDSNSSVRYGGIKFTGGETIIISTSSGNSSIDTDYGYTYSGGKVLAICPNGMTQEVTNADTWSSKATYKNMTLSKGSTVKVTVGSSTAISVDMPVSISNAFVVYLGSNSATISA